MTTQLNQAKSQYPAMSQPDKDTFKFMLYASGMYTADDEFKKDIEQNLDAELTKKVFDEKAKEIIQKMGDYQKEQLKIIDITFLTKGGKSRSKSRNKSRSRNTLRPNKSRGQSKQRSKSRSRDTLRPGKSRTRSKSRK